MYQKMPKTIKMTLSLSNGFAKQSLVIWFYLLRIATITWKDLSQIPWRNCLSFDCYYLKLPKIALGTSIKTVKIIEWSRLLTVLWDSMRCNYCDNFPKQPSRGVLMKRRSESRQQIYRKTPMPKCNFNKVAKQLYWNQFSAWVMSCKFAVYFQNTFP